MNEEQFEEIVVSEHGSMDEEGEPREAFEGRRHLVTRRNQDRFNQDKAKIAPEPESRNRPLGHDLPDSIGWHVCCWSGIAGELTKVAIDGAREFGRDQ